MVLRSGKELVKGTASEPCQQLNAGRVKRKPGGKGQDARIRGTKERTKEKIGRQRKRIKPKGRGGGRGGGHQKVEASEPRKGKHNVHTRVKEPLVNSKNYSREPTRRQGGRGGREVLRGNERRAQHVVLWSNGRERRL